MADRNKTLPPPPLPSSVVQDNKIIAVPWENWVNTLHYLNSNANFQDITAASNVALDARYVSLTTTSGGGTYAITLSAPTIPGVLKVIEMIVRGGSSNVTMSLSNCTSGSAATTCTWNSVGDTLTLISKSNKWVIIDEDGVSLT